MLPAARPRPTIVSVSGRASGRPLSWISFPAAPLGLNFGDGWKLPHVGDGIAGGFAGRTASREMGDWTGPGSGPQ